ncbi:MAG TPA: alpha/beta hydrolase [Marmoricola sp.]|jgi:pimeloyl-ACP methyl ester carboxylesterase|nr:alpha/beta hydrolase [Marmoricola sp.]
MSTRLPESARIWRQEGRTIDVDGRSVFVHDTGEGPVIVVIHGFPSCSYDWAAVVPLLPGRVVALDLPGYGFSDKSPDASYSLFAQADVVDAVLGELGVDRCSIVAHDMGDTVTAELACRANSGELGFVLDAIVLTNGSVFIDMAQLTRGQQLTLRLPARRSMFSMPTPLLRRSLLESFTRTAPPPAGAIGGLIALIQYGGGDRLLPLLIRYIEERRAHQDRWTAGFVDFAGPITLIWGVEDPIAVIAMTERMAELRSTTTVVRLAGIGHWPSLECPDRLAGEIRTALG